MAKYKVSLHTVLSFTVEVDAEDEERAIEAAYARKPSEVQGSTYEQTMALDLNSEWQLNEPDVEEIP